MICCQGKSQVSEMFVEEHPGRPYIGKVLWVSRIPSLLSKQGNMT